MEAAGAALVLHQQAIDTTTPAGRMFFQVTGAFAEFERAMIRSRVRAGLERAKARGVRLGRPRTGDKVEAAIRARLATGEGIKKVAKAVGVGNGTVSRIKTAMATATGRSNGRSVENAATADALNPAESRREGDGHRFTRGVRRLRRIPPAAIAAMTTLRCGPTMPSAVRRARNANCAKMRK